MRISYSSLVGLLLLSHAASLHGQSDGGNSPPFSLWSFDKDSNNSACDESQGLLDPISGNFEHVRGISGKGLKFDGFRTFIKRDRMPTTAITDAFTIESWIAPAAYPWSWSPILDCSRHELNGFFFGINQIGQVGFKIAIGNDWVELTSQESIPLRKWSHLAAVYRANDRISILMDGKEVATSKVNGEYVPSRGSATIGRSNNSTTWREYQLTTPDAYFFLDCILDEIQLTGKAKTPDEIHASLAKMDASQKPELSERNTFPTGPKGSGTFGAFYTKLNYYKEWEAMWRVGNKSDVYVRFADSPVQFIFWRGASYVPCWVSENGIWTTNEWLETWGTDVQGCAEPIMDRECKYSHVRIIESNSARVVIHWRYALNDSFYKIAAESNDGRGEWCDEYHVIYPDMTGIRIQQLHYSPPLRRHDWLEQMIVLPPGHYPKDVIENEEFTLVNMNGDFKNYSYQNIASKLTMPEKANISLINTKSQFRPYIIVAPDPVDCVEGKWDSPPFISYSAKTGKGFHPEPAATIYGWWNHWPVAQIPGDGRWVITPDKASHLLVTAGVHWVDYQKDERTRTRILFQGMTKDSAKDLVPLAKAWLSAPAIKLNTKDFKGGGYDRSEKAYMFENTDSSMKTDLEFTAQASEASPLINPAFIVKNWGGELPKMMVNSKIVESGKDLKMSIRSTAESDDLIIWSRLKSTNDTSIRIKR